MNIGPISRIYILLVSLTALVSCKAKQEDSLPIFGERNVVQREVDGKKVNDTIYHTIGHFEFIDQDSTLITQETFKGKIYVADFFFTSCRTICPIMKTQMHRLYDSIQNEPDILILSHTIDPKYDTVGLLHEYAQGLGVKSEKWHFVTGQQDSIYSIAQKGYFATAMQDDTEPEGFIHSGAFLLIDKKGRVRGKYDGTKEPEVNRLIADLKILKKD